MKNRLQDTPLKRFSMLSFMLFFPVITVLAQDVQFPKAIISSGGGNAVSGPVNLTRWRIGQINVVTFPSENPLKQASVIATTLPLETTSEWSVKVYPNPVNTILHVNFDMKSQGEFNLEIYDARGSKLISENGLIILPGQVAKLDLTGLTPALYLLKVIPSVQGTQKIFKITKK